MNWWGISEVWEVHCNHVNFERLELSGMAQSIYIARQGMVSGNWKPDGTCHINISNMQKKSAEENIPRMASLKDVHTEIKPDVFVKVESL